MQKFKTRNAFCLVFILAMALDGCAIFPSCSPENCATDKQIKADVSQILSEHPEFGPPAGLHIQVINGVVYMSGAVNSDFEVRRAEELVRHVANVKDVQNNLNPRRNWTLKPGAEARRQSASGAMRNDNRSVVPLFGVLATVSSAPMSCACSRKPTSPK